MAKTIMDSFKENYLKINIDKDGAVKSVTVQGGRRSAENKNLFYWKIENVVSFLRMAQNGYHPKASLEKARNLITEILQDNA